MISQLLTAIIGGAIGSLVTFLFNRNIERIRREQLIKDKASAVAELFAKLVRREGCDPNERAYDCTRISYELSLYLPTDLYKTISERALLNPKVTAQDWYEVLRLVKNHLHNTNETDPILAVAWTPDNFIIKS